jgi:hypothetical protein
MIDRVSTSDSSRDSKEPAPNPLPAWASASQASIPLGYLAKSSRDPERFWLGEAPHRALVLLDPAWRTEPGEAWVGVAAGCYKALCSVDCSREIAELIAKGWMMAVNQYESDQIRRRVQARILVPQHPRVQ